LLAIWLFIYLFRYPATIGSIESSMFLCAALGILIALTAAVRPLSEILLVAVILCVLPCTVRFDKNEKLLNGRISRALCQGWFRALAILICFSISNTLLSLAISNAIDYKLPGGSVSFGYNFMVGVNIDAKGAWNQQDADFFANEFATTNSAEAAHRASVGVALGRVRDDPVGVLNLAMEKFTFLWENDDYAASWTTLFLGQQGNLTPERQSIINYFTVWNDAAYLTCIFLSAVLGFRLVRRRFVSPVQCMILVFVGTVLLHMILESQNRYHYFVLPILMILAAMAIADIYQEYNAEQSTAQNRIPPSMP